MPAFALLLLLAAAPPESLRLHLLVAGQPVGEVQLTRAGTSYRYTSVHAFVGEGGVTRRERTARYTLDAAGHTPEGLTPAGLWLWRPPAAGCTEGLEELEELRGPLCAEAREGGVVRGTLRGLPFRAAYGPDGQLSGLTLPGARFVRASSPEALRPSAPLLARGLPLPEGEGPLAWAPALPARPPPALSPWREEAARALAARVRASLPEEGFGPADTDATREEVRQGGCLAHARRFALWASRAGQQVALVHGLVAHAGRLMPHAWVRVGLAGGRTLELDVARAEEVRPGTHLALAVVGPAEDGLRVGERWLSVLAGSTRPARATAP